MGGGTHKRTMNGSAYSRYGGDAGGVCCRVCKAKLEKGDKYVSRYRSRSEGVNAAALYCIPCAQEKNLID